MLDLCLKHANIWSAYGGIMNLIQKLILKQYCGNKAFNQIIEECLQFEELDTYLACLDMKAKFEQEDFVAIDNMATLHNIIKQETILLKILQSKFVEVVLESGANQSGILLNATILQDQLGDEDIILNEVDDNKTLHKVYIIVKEIKQALELMQVQEKSLIQNCKTFM